MEYHLNLNVQSFSELSDTARQLLSAHPSDPVKIRDVIYFRVGNQVYSCRDCPESRELITRLVSSDSGKVISSEDAVWKSALNGIADPALYEEYRLRDRMCRTVVLFRPMQRMERFALQNNIPLESSDRLISMDNGDVALILHMNERSEYEPFEYAEAVTETMESEAGIACYAGVGRPSDSLDTLSVSYEEARSALETGLKHHQPGRVFSYSKQALERLTDLIPVDRASVFLQKELSPEAQKVLTDEMLETIRVFFQNDLNLSTTARQLFIHRNTLLYRMDKIRKATGLDLRRFEDAVVFRFLMSFSDRSINDDKE